MLIEIWDEIHRGLERKKTSVNLMAVDFEKAFNRMDHGECLESLGELGASPGSLALVQAFLHGRHMSVNSCMSAPKLVAGGSPQGSILGGYLFGATINSMLCTTIEAGETPPPPALTLTRPRSTTRIFT